jgi:hypothetical protein
MKFKIKNNDGAWNTFSFSNDTVFDAMSMSNLQWKYPTTLFHKKNKTMSLKEALSYRILEGYNIDHFNLAKKFINEVMTDEAYRQMCIVGIVLIALYNNVKLSQKEIKNSIQSLKNEIVKINEGIKEKFRYPYGWTNPESRLERIIEEINYLKSFTVPRSKTSHILSQEHDYILKTDVSEEKFRYILETYKIQRSNGIFNKVLISLPPDKIYRLAEGYGKHNAFDPKLFKKFFSKWEDRTMAYGLGFLSGEPYMEISFPYWDNQRQTNYGKRLKKSQNKKISEEERKKYIEELLKELLESDLSGFEYPPYIDDFDNIHIIWD